MIKPFIILSLLFVLVTLWLFINEYRIRKDPHYKQKQIEAEKRRKEAVKLREEQERKKIIEKEIEEHKLRQHVAYNAWMRKVYHYSVSSFQITDSKYQNGPREGPWASSLFNDDVRAHIDSQEIPLHLREKKDIEEVKYSYSPQGLEEGRIIMDILLTKGPKAAEIALKKMKKNRRL